VTGSLVGLRLAVTGASGFCGAAVARAAQAAGADVLCLGRRPGPVGRHVPWDAARDRPYLDGADAVVHLAAAVGDPRPGAADEETFRSVNVDGTRRLIDVARSRPVVYVSSASVYAPPGRDAAPLREEHPVRDQRTAYGRTKAAGERHALDAGAVVLRPRAVYGPGDPHLLPRLLGAVRRGLAPLPGPDVPMSLTAVENLAEACLAALSWSAGPYNIADAPTYRRDRVVRDVLAACGVPARLVHVPTGLAYLGAAALASRPVRRLAPSWRPALTAYAVDQLTGAVVLDTQRARSRGWRPHRDLDDFLSTLHDHVDPRVIRLSRSRPPP
jgi:nucleoside-diphosphate-sugar epimerase